MTVSTVTYEPVEKRFTLHVKDSLEQETLSIEGFCFEGNRLVMFEDFCGTSDDQGMIRRDALGSLTVQTLAMVTLFRMGCAEDEDREEFNLLSDPLEWLFETSQPLQLKVLQGDWVSGLHFLKTYLGEDFYRWVEQSTQDWVIFPPLSYRSRGSELALDWRLP